MGAGFGGLYAARELRAAPVDVTLVDERNHHLFQPLLYQVATASLNPSDIAAPVRRILRKQTNVAVVLGRVTEVDVAGKRVLLEDDVLAYDFLVLAVGVTHSYFGHPEWGEHAPGLKSIEDALEIRRRVLVAFELAERTPDPATRSRALTFVVVGGGPTGVELAGALAEISRHALARDFQRIDPAQARIVLVEGVERILPGFPEKLSTEARRQLERLGVEVRTASKITSVDCDGVAFATGRIEAGTVLWAAGVQASPLAASLGVPLDRAGRVVVRSDLTIPGRADVFVVGDMAAFEQDGTTVPGVAPAAIQGGRQAARNIHLALADRPYEPFRYVEKGMLVTIGRGAAVADIRRLRFSGFPAWVAWLIVHIFWLIGFRNRLVVMLQWVWAYWTRDRSARLITGRVGPLLAPPRGAPDRGPAPPGGT